MPHALSPYPDAQERQAELVQLLDRHNLELLTYGYSVQGRALVAFKIPSSSSQPSGKEVMVGANIHGIEHISNRVAMGFAQAALENADLSDLCAAADIWILPCINPDGHHRTLEQEGRGRVVQLRTNARGVDLNRNFPWPFVDKPGFWPGAGSARLGDATYRGTGALSEPETQSLHDFLTQRDMWAAINLHSFMGTVIPPRVRTPSTYRAYGNLARAFAAGQPRWRYWRLANRWLDTVTGEQEDHQHHHFRTWAVCMETFSLWASLRQHFRAPRLFWRFNPHDPAEWVANDIRGIHSYLLAALALPRAPTEASSIHKVSEIVEGAENEE